MRVYGVIRRAIMLNLLHVKNTRPRIRTASPLLRACGNFWRFVPGCQLMVNVVDPDSVPNAESGKEF